MVIDGRHITPENPPYLIAEISCNHLGDKSRAFALIEAAKTAGADAVKLQCYTPDSMTIKHEGLGFSIERGPWKGKNLYDLYAEAQTPYEWFPDLFTHARAKNITCFASVFDVTGIAVLEKVGTPAYKIASFDLVDIPLIQEVAKTNKPIILSTGMASWDDIKEADDALGAEYPHLFLHCVSGYPTQIHEAALQYMAIFKRLLAMSVGLSDHSLGNEVAIAATAMGAVAIEKHLTLARSDGGPDAAFSLEPHEFAAMVKAVRDIWNASAFTENLPKGFPRRPQAEETSLPYRKSVYVCRPIARGDLLTPENVRVIRPGYGIPPKFYKSVLGKPALNDLAYGCPLSWTDVFPAEEP